MLMLAQQLRKRKIRDKVNLIDIMHMYKGNICICTCSSSLIRKREEVKYKDRRTMRFIAEILEKQIYLHMLFTSISFHSVNDLNPSSLL